VTREARDISQPTDSARPGLEPFYFGEANRELFGIYHPPAAGTRRGSSLVLCYPFGQEYIRCHRSFRQLAIRASGAGFPVLRFDYYGCGDSAGHREDGSVDQWLNDVSTSVSELRRRAQASNVCLVGLRFGATLATLAAAGRGDVAGLVLWDPILNGSAYLDELRAGQGHSADSSRTFAGPGRMTGALGFPLTSELSTSIGRVSLAAIGCRPAPHVLVIESQPGGSHTGVCDALTRLGARVETRHLPSPPIWTKDPTMLVPGPILQAIVSWTIERFP
jgi:pimeloyl-ACP methyl ester carboxylesterase